MPAPPGNTRFPPPLRAVIFPVAEHRPRLWPKSGHPSAWRPRLQPGIPGRPPCAARPSPPGLCSKRRGVRGKPECCRTAPGDGDAATDLDRLQGQGTRAGSAFTRTGNHRTTTQPPRSAASRIWRTAVAMPDAVSTRVWRPSRPRSWFRPSRPEHPVSTMRQNGAWALRRRRPVGSAAPLPRSREPAVRSREETVRFQARNGERGHVC